MGNLNSNPTQDNTLYDTWPSVLSTPLPPLPSPAREDPSSKKSFFATAQLLSPPTAAEKSKSLTPTPLFLRSRPKDIDSGDEVDSPSLLSIHSESPLTPKMPITPPGVMPHDNHMNKEKDFHLGHTEYSGGTDEKKNFQGKSQEVTVPTLIHWNGGGNNVFVTGSFNEWRYKIPLVKSTTDFLTVLELPPGTHRLKFVVDDEWQCNSELDEATDAGGHLVNFIHVPLPGEDGHDFGSFDSTIISPLELRGWEREQEDEEGYSREIPAYLLPRGEGGPEAEEGRRKVYGKKPTSLPRHFEKVMLNKHTFKNHSNRDDVEEERVDSEGETEERDASVLPVPAHVTLNHLYTSSVRDGVVALGMTVRYHRKHITTMYYRPLN
ncbi:uncharacterized protein VTP21DRAFT_6378 [Calcarisporiella thermophila]|uniref:uncharacterized protein n=1 Tax=Calcarisporiella thermophila TaxID=911321 RepID=UPI003744338F